MKSFGCKLKYVVGFLVVVLAVCVFVTSLTPYGNTLTALAEEGTVVNMYNGLEITGGSFAFDDSMSWWDLTLITQAGDRTLVFAQDYSNLNNLSITIQGKTTTETIRLDLNGHRINCIGHPAVKIGHPKTIITNECNTEAYGEFTLTDDAVVSLYGGENTTCRFIIERNSTPEVPVLIYSGKVTRLGKSGTGIVLTKALPQGYGIIAYLNDGTQKAMPYSTAETIDNFLGYVEDDHPDWYVKFEDEYITAISTFVCNHDSITGNVCDYCNETLDSGKVLESYKRELEEAKNEYLTLLNDKADKETLDQAMISLNESIRLANELISNNKNATDSEINELKTAIATAKAEAIQSANDSLDSAKNELNSAISTKAETNYVNEKVTELNNAITNAIITANAYADNKDTALKTTLETAIATAKAEAIQSATESLEKAKAELTDAINRRMDLSTIDTKINNLNTSLSNLETTCKAYNDEQSDTLKAEIEQEIASAKTLLQNAIDELSARLDTAENKIEQTENNVDIIKTFMYVMSGLVAVLGILVIVLSVALKRVAKLMASENDKE